MHRRWVGVGVGVLALVSLVAGLLWWLHPWDGSSSSAAAASPGASGFASASGVPSRSAGPSLAPPTAEQVTALLASLTSGEAAQVSTAVWMGNGQPVPASAVAGFKSLAPLKAQGTVEKASDGSGVATVPITTAAGAKWTVVLAPVDGRWLIVDTWAG
ncbi:MAG: hypothetical protein V9F00_04865 [Nocardioides sp.]